MRLQPAPVHSWLSRRIRLLCVGIFAVSLFLPPYVPQSVSAVPDLAEQDTTYLLSEDGFLLKTSSLTEQGTRGTFASGIIHTVEPGESIASIARSNGITADTIRWANSLTPSEGVQPGQKLFILPVDGIIHTVKRGQNLSSIAELYGVPAEKIALQNKIQGGYLQAGQDLIIPGGKPIVPGAKLPAEGALTFNPALPSTSLNLPSTAPAPAEIAAPQPTYSILQRPCNCYITQYFSAIHFGLDMQQKGGGPVFAAEDGTVSRADYGWNGGYGNVIEIDHGNGLVTLYGHNKELRVTVGDHVKRGQLISLMGNTGLVHGPTGIHVHFEVHVNGVKRNPLLYIQE